MIVCADADLDRAAVGSRLNGGQYCCGTGQIEIIERHVGGAAPGEYTRKAEDGMQKFIRLLYGTRLRRWLGR